MKLRRLTPEGLQAWRNLLDDVAQDGFDERRSRLATDPELTIELPGEVAFSDEILRSRLDVARYLDQVVATAGIDDPELDAGLWSWLALAGFEQLCVRRKDGSWSPGEWYRWIFQPRDYKVYYRHLLAGPYLIFRAHNDDPERVAVVMCGAVGSPGEAVEQLASTQAFVSSQGAMGLATDLYYDRSKRTLKRGAGGKGPGAPRRLAAFLNQLDLTWDLFTLGRQELMAMVPSEFDRYRK